MNKKASIFIILFLVFIQNNNLFAKEITLGAGLANYYSGLGINTGILKDNNIYYVSAGCPTLAGSSDAGMAAVCGVGGGWMSTSIIPQENNKHAVGLYAGIISGKVKFVNDTSSTDSHYGFGLNYIYYFNNINNNGWNLGLYLGTAKREGAWDVVGGPTAGYQFYY